MAVVHTLGLDSSIVSLGNILGTGGSQELYDSINARAGSGSFFGTMNDPFRQGYQSFITNVVEPIRQSRVAYEQIAARLNSDMYVPICNREVLERGIPTCMEVAILCHPRIQQLHLEERIQGFGYDPLTIPDATDNAFSRAINDGYVFDMAAQLKEHKNTCISFEWCSADDINLTEVEVDAIRSTYQYIDEFMDDEDTKHLDFTSFPDLHG